MTATAHGVSPHHTSALPRPTAAEVVLLQSIQDYPAVSVLCPTEPATQMPRATIARLNALVAQAAQRLRAELDSSRAAPLITTLSRLAGDIADRPTEAAVAMYVSSHHESAWSLPVSVIDRVVVDPTFATRDLVRALHRTPRHVVLVLTDREARLFDGVGDTLLPPYGGPFPLRAPSPARPQRRGGPARTTNGTDVAEQGDAFLRTVDSALGAYLRLHPAPLVLVGASRTIARFRHLSRNAGRLAGVVHGSHARTALPLLAGLIRPVLETYLRSRQDEALALLDRRTGAGRVVGGMAAVWLAARADRPEMLAVEQGLFYPARISADGDFLTPADDVDHPEVIDDAVDEVIETVLRRGGWVALVDDGALRHHDRIALSVRRQ